MPPELETEEIEVTQIIERLETLEKEISHQKEKIATLEKHAAEIGKKLDSCVASIDRVADLLGKRG